MVANEENLDPRLVAAGQTIQALRRTTTPASQTHMAFYMGIGQTVYSRMERGMMDFRDLNRQQFNIFLLMLGLTAARFEEITGLEVPARLLMPPNWKDELFEIPIVNQPPHKIKINVEPLNLSLAGREMAAYMVGNQIILTVNDDLNEMYTTVLVHPPGSESIEMRNNGFDDLSGCTVLPGRVVAKIWMQDGFHP